MITYPRKCLHCDYVANNPAMYSYHKQTHLPIPDNTYCHFGCGGNALFRNTGGKYTCCDQYQKCPAYIDQLSERTKQSWVGSDTRKEQTKKSLVDRLHTRETINKMKETKRKKFGLLTPEAAKEYRHYARAIRVKAQQWAKEQGYVLGQQTYHVDHKLSILDAWHAGLSADIVSHPANLQILEAKKNSSKGAKSSITVEELLILIS
jgi:hypothetical protein